MPLEDTEVEPTEEIHSIIGKMEHGKFYRFVELYEMTYGDPFYVDLQKNDDNKTPWLFLMKVLDLKTQLDVLVLLAKLKTGRRKGEEEDEVNVAGHVVLGGPVVYYARK